VKVPPVQLRRTVVIALAVTRQASCSTAEIAAGETASQRQYQTGSNVPRKDRSGDKVQTYGSDSVQQPLPPPSRPPAGAGGGGG
jgi:hypothetical protein